MKKCLSLILIGVLVSVVSGGKALARNSGQDDAKALERIRAKIAKLGVGEKARAQIKLRNGVKIKGFVSSVGTDDFAFTERDSGKTTTVAYADVVEVKKPGGLSKSTKILIVAGIGAGVVVGLIAHHIVNCFFGCR